MDMDRVMEEVIFNINVVQTRPRNLAMVYAIKAIESVMVPTSTSSAIVNAAIANEPWFNQATNTAATSNTQNIYQMGNVGIGTTAPTAKLHVIGNVIATGGYADYVLEDFVDGTSSLNPTYDRKSLTDVKEFIKTNKHLPGVTSIKDLKLASNGEYEIDITKLQVQLLEKIEELYLHTIEQQEQIEVLKIEIKSLKNKK